MKVKVLCKVVVHEGAIGRKDEIIDLPDEVAASLIKAKRVEAVAEGKKK